jgi:hypothetical protein
MRCIGSFFFARMKELGDERRLCWARNMKDYRT